MEKFFEKIALGGFLGGRDPPLLLLLHFAPRFLVANLHKEIGERTEHHRDEDGDEDDLDLAPAAFFKVMMNGRHFEDAFFGELIARYLQDDGHGLHDITKTDYDDDERASDQKGKTRQKSAEEKRARIAHENAGGIPVVYEKADTSAKKCAAHIRNMRKRSFRARHEKRADREKYGDDGGDGRAKSIDAVCEIDAVIDTDDEEKSKYVIRLAMIRWYLKLRVEG